MKRVFTIFICILSFMSVFAKTNDNKNYRFKSLGHGFEGQLRMPFVEGVDWQKNFSFGVDLVAAYRFDSICRIGIGAGLQFINLRYEEPLIIREYMMYKNELYIVKEKEYPPYYESAVTIPLFANLKFNFIPNKISPYLSIDIGYKFYVPCSKFVKKNELGFFIAPALGVDIRFEKYVMNIGLGYEYQCRSFTNSITDDTYKGYSSVMQYIAFSF